MASRKSYFSDKDSTTEMIIQLNKDGGLYVELYEDMGFPMENIVLAYEDAKEIIENLYSNLKEYEKAKDERDKAAKV